MRATLGLAMLKSMVTLTSSVLIEPWKMEA